jgi:hypothetical protein
MKSRKTSTKRDSAALTVATPLAAPDVLAVLQGYVKNGVLSLPSNAFSGPVQLALTQFAGGTLVVTMTPGDPTGSNVSAKFSGSGTSQPFGASTVTATVTAEDTGDVTLVLVATITPNWSLASAWPALAGTTPFNKITISSGNLELDATTSDVTIQGAVAAAYGGTNFGSAILEVQYADSKLGWLLGAIAGDFNAGVVWSALNGLDVKGVGVFASTITAKDLKDGTGKALTFPAKVDPGLTAYAQLSLDKGPLTALQPIFPNGTTFDFLATLSPTGALDMKGTVTESLAVGDMTFQGFALDWNLGASTISLSSSALFAFSGEQLTLSAQGTLAYSGVTSGSLNILILNWVHPFGIQFLTIEDFGVDVTISAEGVGMALGGTFDLACTTPPGPTIQVVVIGEILDFEAPGGIVLEAKSEDKNTAFTIPELVGVFIPSIGTAIAQLPFINDFSINELQIIAVDAPFTFNGVTYGIGLSVDGNITFCSWTLIFAFSFEQGTKGGLPGVKASGSISAPITVSVGGVTLVSLSDTTGATGPSASIDTTGSPYFTMNGKLQLLGITDSLSAYVGSDRFSFQATFSLFDVVNAQLACSLNPSSLEFSASASFSAHLPQLVLPALTIDGVTIIPSITLTPDISVSVGVSISSQPASFGFNLAFSIAGFSVSVSPTFDLSAVVGVFDDFDSFVKNWLVNNVKTLFASIWADLKKAAEFLKNLAVAAADAIAALAKWFVNETIDAITSVVNDVWTAIEGCAEDLAGGLLSEGGSDAVPMGVFANHLVDLTATGSGQRALRRYYLHQHTIAAQLSANPEIRNRVRQSLVARDPSAAMHTCVKSLGNA